MRFFRRLRVGAEGLLASGEREEDRERAREGREVYRPWPTVAKTGRFSVRVFLIFFLFFASVRWLCPRNECALETGAKTYTTQISAEKREKPLPEERSPQIL